MKVLTVLIETPDELIDKHFDEVEALSETLLISSDRASYTIRVRNPEGRS